MGFSILYLGLLLVLLYRQFVLQEYFPRNWDLDLLFFGTAFYIVFKRIGAGLLTVKINWRHILLSSIIAAVSVCIVNFWWLDNGSLIDIIVGGFIFFIGFYGIGFLMHYFSSRKNEEMLKED